MEEAYRLAAEWGLDDPTPLEGATCSVVLRSGDHVLKQPLVEEEATHGRAALRAFSGHGGVEVLREDDATGSSLMAWLPGPAACDVPEEDAIEAFVEVARQLREAPFDPSDFPRYEDWYRIEPDLSEEALATRKRLVETTPSRVLLHGDLHHFNLLRDRNGAWTAIDPKGILGDPAYEATAILRNCVPARAPRDVLRRRVDLIASGLDLDPVRVLEWGWMQTELGSLSCSEPERSRGLRTAETLRQILLSG